jgi:hypothetical protein
MWKNRGRYVKIRKENKKIIQAGKTKKGGIFYDKIF